MKKSPRITAPRLWLVITKSYRVLSLLAEQSIANAGLCLTDFAALEALLHKGPLTISQIQEKVLLASGSLYARRAQVIDGRGSWNSRRKVGGWRHRASSDMQRTWRRSCQHCPKRRWTNSTDRLRSSGCSQRKNLRNKTQFRSSKERATK